MRPLPLHRLSTSSPSCWAPAPIAWAVEAPRRSSLDCRLDGLDPLGGGRQSCRESATGIGREYLFQSVPGADLRGAGPEGQAL